MSQKGYSTIIIIIGVVTLLLIGFLVFNLIFKERGMEQGEPENNTQIMYGYKDYEEYLRNRPKKLKELDEDYTNAIMNTGEFKSKAELAQETCELGYEYIKKDDKETAIKRFNQAWFVDHNHPCIYAGYGHYLAFSTGEVEKSFEMYEKALSLSNVSNPNYSENSWWVLVDYAEILTLYYGVDNKSTDYLDKAFDNLTKSLAITDAPKTHRVLAFVYYYKKDFKKSWNQVHLAVDGGVDLKNFGQFINDLKKEMPDPEGKI